MSAFVHRDETNSRMAAAMEAIQPGLFGNIFEHVWLAPLAYMNTPTERKQAAVAL